MMRTFPILLIVAILAALLPACAPPIAVPIRTISLVQSGAARQQTLLVFLPGRYDSSQSYGNEGFIAAAQARGVAADMIGVEAHIGYYARQQLLPRLKQDVIEPARRQGYRQIWLVGISMGGIGALWYDIENPGELAGVIALSPYLGEPEIIAEVARAGGLAAWQPPAEGPRDDQQSIWRGLKTYLQRERSGERVYLGYGRDDPFAEADGLLAAALPPDQVFVVDGGHDWETWRAIWNRILPNSPLIRTAPVTPAPAPPHGPGG